MLGTMTEESCLLSPTKSLVDKTHNMLPLGLGWTDIIGEGFKDQTTNRLNWT